MVREKMIFVIDTDVFLSGFIMSSYYPVRLIDYFSDERFAIALDDRIYFEYVSVLNRAGLGFESRDVNYLLKFINEIAMFVTAGKLNIDLIYLSDLKFVEVAKSARVDAVITNNVEYFESARDVITALTPEEVFEELL
ncbi:PIN domain-containing protein [Candidatus Acidulodesulfobacterium sp. H_13]|uniref:PIN domain-containing protein n=1 Tax=Candidatus Acidulodesulfobacterium sp. H_13 TaxID=3395470 RepID=UPI003AF7846C